MTRKSHSGMFDDLNRDGLLLESMQETSRIGSTMQQIRLTCMLVNDS